MPRESKKNGSMSPEKIKELINQAVTANDFELAQSLMDQLKAPVAAEKSHVSRSRSRSNGSIFKENLFDKMNHEELVPRAENYRKVGRKNVKIATPQRDGNSIRESTLTSVVCSGCKRVFEVSSSLISESVFKCNDCIIKRN